MFKIGEFSMFTQVSIRMLRYYDKIGLFEPAYVDTFTGYRYYTAKQISMLNKIITLRDMGFVVAEIAIALKCDDDGLLAILAQKQEDIKGTIENESTKLDKVTCMMNSLGKEIMHMHYEVKIKEVPAYKVISLRDIVEKYQNEGELWGRLCEYMGKHSIPMDGLGFAIYHGDECMKEDVDIEVAMCTDEVREELESCITFREVEAVSCMASIMITGSYDKLASAYQSLGEWVEESHYEVCGLARQVTHKGPWCEENPDNYLTEIQMPVKKINE